MTRRLLIAVAFAALLFPALATGQTPPPACGGGGQRACCATERATACNRDFEPVDLGQFPGACGIFGAATCMPKAPVTPCGGEGQRACCDIEVTPSTPVCQVGLTLRPDDGVADRNVPNSGDFTCSGAVIAGSGTRISTGTCISATPGSIPEPSTGWSGTNSPRSVMSGYLDMHLHLLGDMAHGGKNLVGEPAPRDAGGKFVLDDTFNINSALSPATDLLIHHNSYHGLTNDKSGDGTQDGSRTEFGAPYFNGWPKWKSTTHQQAYYVWLERAWRGGLRAITLFASHTESLCKTSRLSEFPDSWISCEDSMSHVLKQLVAARDFQTFIDRISGGPGQGWFRIVTTPAEARDAVRAGKLAVVLGIEVDNLFNCKEAGCPANFGLPTELIRPLTTLPQPTTLAEAVNVIHDMGVRQVFPIHNFDNAFGGSATWMDTISVAQFVTEGRWWVTRDCGEGIGEYGFQLSSLLQIPMLSIGFLMLPVPPPPFPLFPAAEYAACNQFGLSAQGRDLLGLLMSKGMLIDIDHSSARSFDETLALTSAGVAGNGPAYPVVASHVQPFDLHRRKFRDNAGRHERMRTRAQLVAIRDSGGMVAAMLKDDVQDTGLIGERYSLSHVPLFGGQVVDNCRHSSKSWAQAFTYEVDVMGGPVAMGSDFNGAAGHLAPRFGSDACGGWSSPNGLERPFQEFEQNRIQYPFTLPGFGEFNRQTTGFKAFDYNVDGLAHIGLLPDLVADLGAVGLDPHYIESLFCSAEAYIRVWERADALSKRQPAPDLNRPWLCTVTDSTPPESVVALAPGASSTGWHRGDVAATITATDTESGVASIDYSVTIGAQTLSDGGAGASKLVTLTGEGDRELTYFATDHAGNVEAPNALTVRIDRTAPVIAASASPLANAAGWNNSAVTVTFSCSDALSGIDTCAASKTLSGEGTNQSANGDAADNAGNTATATVGDIKIDLTKPIVEITGVTDGAVYDLGAVPLAGCSTSDPMSGVATAAVLTVTGGTPNGVGTFSVSCAGALDKAGNAGAVSASYAVHYVFSNFLSPMENPPAVNAIRAGQTVPVTFSLGGDRGLAVLSSATSMTTSCVNGSVVDLTELTVVNPGASVFAYDSLTGQYQFNWKTDRSWAGTCRRLSVRFDDGTVHIAEFRLR